jgi:chromate transporter
MGVVSETDAGSPGKLTTVLQLVARASTFHVGGIATMSWLRSGLVDTGVISSGQFDRAFAVARLTPGTNLLAFHTAVGYYVARWRGGAAGVALGTLLPSGFIGVISVLYVEHATSPPVARFMTGARAGAIAVLGWTAVRLFVVATARRWLRAIALTAATIAALVSGRVPLVLILLCAAGAGALLFRSDP